MTGSLPLDADCGAAKGSHKNAERSGLIDHRERDSPFRDHATAHLDPRLASSSTVGLVPTTTNSVSAINVSPIRSSIP